MTTADEIETVDGQDDPVYGSMPQMNVAPLWRHYRSLMPAEPRNRAVPYVWHYDELRALAVHFGSALPAAEAERRVLMLVNPALSEPPATVNTLFAGVQAVLPDEIARAHRHSAGAFRFVIEGSGARTTVDGEPVAMLPADLVITPGWQWHDHTHHGDELVTWLDGLDYPLVNALDAGFFEPYPQQTQPTTHQLDASTRQLIHGRLNPVWWPASATTPIRKYPWAETRRALEKIADEAEGSAAEGIQLEYTNPFSGGSVLPTIACRIARLPAGFHGDPRRHTASTIYHVVAGSGSTEVDGNRLDWSVKDIFVVPGWSEYRHHASSGEALLFSYSDEPVLRALGLYREHWL